MLTLDQGWTCVSRYLSTAHSAHVPRHAMPCHVMRVGACALERIVVVGMGLLLRFDVKCVCLFLLFLFFLLFLLL